MWTVFYMYHTRDKNTPSRRQRVALRQIAHKTRHAEVPSWLALFCIATLALTLSGCITARQPYGFDQKAMAQMAAKRSADPIITSALPAGGNWSPQFYPGTGIKPGAPEPQSRPFTPKGIRSTAGMPPKPTVAPVDLPAPPLPLPESTAAPSSTLFGRSSIGRQTGFNNKGLNFGGTALGQSPRLHQLVSPKGLKIFPNAAPAPPHGVRVAGNAALPAPAASTIPFPSVSSGFSAHQPLITAPKVQPLPYPQGTLHASAAPQPQNVFQPQAPIPPAVMAQPRRSAANLVAPQLPPPPPPVKVPPVTNRNLSVYPTRQHPNPAMAGVAPHSYGPTFQMASQMGGYQKRPVPQGAQLIVSSNGYQVDTGDELNIRVLGERDLTGRYRVDSTGSITMPMISTVNVRGRTVSQISNIIQNRLRQGFLRTPSVSVEVISARPFYILGQVKSPGKYNFVNGLTVSQAIAIAGGYEARARKGMVRVTRQTPQGPITAEVPNEEPLMPGDTIYVKQRWF